ncbi:MAG: hypothetical protein J0H81_03925 [Sphingopyxis terrae]|nr:hypothetical protein [Sphingopyxis terrae]
MTTFDSSWSPTVRRIGDLERGDHYYLTDDDQCYFFGEYTARAGYSHSSTNQIIANIKKKPSVRGTPQWQYKLKDMRRVATAFRGAIRPEALPTVTFVPIPPSKLRTHPEHDDRMAAIARAISPHADVRELIIAATDRDPLHESECRLRPDQLAGCLQLDETLCEPAPTRIFLLDDVITTGCSFRTCRQMLEARFPGVLVGGLFAARRVIDHAADFADFDIDL